LLRTWPYIRPQIFGRWWVPGEGIEDRVAEGVAGRGYGFGYMPPLVTAVAIGGPVLGYVPASLAYPLNILYAVILAMALCAWSIPFSKGRVQGAFASALFVLGLTANVVATAYVEGAAVGWYAGTVTSVCVLGWILQFRVDRSRGGARLRCRIRVASHIAYFYGVQGIQGALILVLGLVIADLINQSVLQDEPLTPSMAKLLGQPEMSREVTDELTEEQRMALRWTRVRIMLMVYALLWPLEIIIKYYQLWFIQNINQDLRLAMAERWRRLSLRHHSNHRVGDSIFRIETDAAEVTRVLELFVDISRRIIQSLSYMALLTLLSPWLGLIAVGGLFPILVLARWAMRRFRTRNLVTRMAGADLTSRMHEAFRAVRLSKAYGVEKQSQDRFESDLLIANNTGYREERLHLGVSTARESFTESLILGGVLLMALWANAGRPTFANELIALAGFSFIVWNLTAFQWARGKFSEEVVNSSSDLMDMWGRAQGMAMGLRRVFDILDMESEVQDRPGAIPLDEFSREVRFENVTFAYEEDRPVLDGVSFAVRPGTVTAIIGPTGSGKTTLMNLLLRLYDPDEGSIGIDGRDLRDYEVDSLRSNIAIALQENVLFGMSVRENIRYAAQDASDEAVYDAIRVACMDDFLDGLPEGLDTVLGDRGGRLSTGQRQRLSIARAVVRDAPILVLDEPTAALDADTEHRVLANIAEWSAGDVGSGSGRAVFLITHRLSTIRRADNILYLDGGRIVESGSHDSLMGMTDGRYRAFVQSERNMIDGNEDETGDA
jgi:ABC-type multidrug transport system fused ATPase/permease subunit